MYLTLDEKIESSRNTSPEFYLTKCRIKRKGVLLFDNWYWHEDMYLLLDEVVEVAYQVRNYSMVAVNLPSGRVIAFSSLIKDDLPETAIMKLSLTFEEILMRYSPRAGDREFTLDEQIEFIKHEIEVKKEYVDLVEDEREESKTAQKQLRLLEAVRVSLLNLDLLNKMEAENIEPIFMGDNR